MARTEVNTKQVGDGEITRSDLNTTDSSKAVIARVIAGTGIQISSTGADTGTGDVTISTTESGGSIVTKSANYTALITDGVILCDCSGGGITISLPTAIGNAGKRYDIKKIAGSANQRVTIDPYGAQTIDDGASAELKKKYESITIISDGANWQIL